MKVNKYYAAPTICERFIDALPFIVTIGCIGAIFLSFYLLMPRCPECDEFIHPMDVYCSQCGHQLRTKP